MPTTKFKPFQSFSFSDFISSPPISIPGTRFTQAFPISYIFLSIYRQSSRIGQTIKTTIPYFQSIQG